MSDSGFIENFSAKVKVSLLAVACVASGSAWAQETQNQVPGAGTITAPAAAVTTKKSPLGASLYTYATVGAKSVNDANPAANQYIRPVLKYTLSESRALSLFGQFTYDYATTSTAAGPGRQARAKVGDLVVQYLDTKAVTLPADWNLVFAIRGYLPTGEDSRFLTKKAGAALGIFSFEKSIGKFDFSESFYVLYHNQTQNYYLTSSGDVRANDDFEIDQIFEIAYNFNSVVSLSNQIGTEHVWARGIPGAGVVRTTLFYDELGLTIKPNSNVKLVGAVFTEPTMDSQNAFDALSDSAISYRTYLTLSM